MRFCLAGLICAVAACPLFAANDIGAADIAKNPRLCVPPSANVAFQGQVDSDKSGGTAAPMLYPAPNFVGFIAAIATHGAIIESVKTAQKARIKTEADKVLEPYEAILSTFTLADLYQGCLKTELGKSQKFYIEDSQREASGVRIEADPHYAMTQDGKAIILTNTVSVSGIEGSTPVLFQGVIRVVPKPIVADDIKEYWSRSDGDNLKKLSAELLANSLYVALQFSRDNVPIVPETFRTFRYSEGETRKFERGQLLSENCDRVVVKTLRGNILVIPGSC